MAVVGYLMYRQGGTYSILVQDDNPDFGNSFHSQYASQVYATHALALLNASLAPAGS